SAVTAPVVVGAVGGWLYEKWVRKGPNPEGAERLGVLAASGFIVGESLFNVAYAGLIVATNKDAPLAVPFAPSESVGMIFAALAEQACGIALAAVVGMDADAAGFGIAVGPHPLAGHGDELAIDPHADEVAELMGSREERAGLGQGRQGQHLGRIGVAQVQHV